jgi:hypothetical protein
MTPASASRDRAIETTRRIVSHIALWIIIAGLVGGLVLSLAGQPPASVTAYKIAAVVMLVLPVTGVIAVLFEEIKRRDWWFAAAALGVIVLIAYRLLELFA